MNECIFLVLAFYVEEGCRRPHPCKLHWSICRALSVPAQQHETADLRLHRPVYRWRDMSGKAACIRHHMTACACGAQSEAGLLQCICFCPVQHSRAYNTPNIAQHSTAQATDNVEIASAATKRSLPLVKNPELHLLPALSGCPWSQGCLAQQEVSLHSTSHE